jgi:hypothetical protein
VTLVSSRSRRSSSSPWGTRTRNGRSLSSMPAPYPRVVKFVQDRAAPHGLPSDGRKDWP